MGAKHIQLSKEERQLKTSYYNSLNKTIKKIYDKNHFNIFNQAYSLHIKTFNKLNNRIKIQTSAYSFINWKEYLYSELDKLRNKYRWSENLIEYIQTEQFANQLKYQNLFFFQEYEMISFYKNSNIFAKFDESAILSFLDENVLKKIPRNLSENEEKILTTSKSECSIASSSYSIRSDSFIKDFKLNKHFIKKYINILKVHLSEIDHPIHNIIYQFIEELKPHIEKIINSHSNNNFSENSDNEKKKIIDILTQIQKFIEIMQIVLKLFYSRSVNYRNFVDETDEIINLITNIFFNIGDIYKLIMELLKILNKEKILKLEKQLQNFRDLAPQDFGIAYKFCLNENTDNLIVKFIKEYKINIENLKLNNNILNLLKKEENFDDSKSFNNSNLNLNDIDDMDDNINISTVKKKLRVGSIGSCCTFNVNTKVLFLEDIENDFNIKIPRNETDINNIKNQNNEPYFSAIKYLKHINDYKMPLEKLAIIAVVSSIIIDCVNNYWNKVENYLDYKFLKIDADELVSIYLYIVYKLDMPYIFIQMDFIKYFTTSATKNSIIGYYFTAVEGCLDYILDAKDKSSFSRKKV